MFAFLRIGLFVCLALASVGAWAQVGIGTAIPKTRTILELENGGVARVLQLPRINASDRISGGLSALGAQYAGSVVVDTSGGTTTLYFFNGSQWVTISPFIKVGNQVRLITLTDSLALGVTSAKAKLFVDGNIGITQSASGRRIFVDSATGTNNAGPLFLDGARGGSVSGNGGLISLRSGNAVNGNGGNMIFTAGSGGTTGNGGSLNMNAGNAIANTGSSGSVTIFSGTIPTTSTSGSTGTVTIASRAITGTTTTGSTGNVSLTTGPTASAAGGSSGNLNLSTGSATSSTGNISTGNISISTGFANSTTNRRAGNITISPGNSAGATYGAELRLTGGNTNLASGFGGKIRLQAGTSPTLANYGNITLNPLGGGVAVGNDTVPEYVAFQVKSPASGKGLLLPQVSSSDLFGGDLSGLTPVIHEGMIVADTLNGGLGLAYYNGGDWYKVMTTAEDQTLVRNGFRLTTISANDSLGIGSTVPYDQFSVGNLGQFRVNGVGGIFGDRLSLATLSGGGPVRANPITGLLQASAINLGSTDVTGTTPIASGGTGTTTFTANGVVTVNAAGTALGAFALNDGQVLVGRSGLSPIATTLTAGPGISITNGPGSISITNTAGGVTNGTTANNTLRWSGSAWVESNFLTNSGTRIGINDNTPDFPVDATSADPNTIRAVNSGVSGYALRGEQTALFGAGAGVYGSNSSSGSTAAGVYGVNNAGVGGGVRGETINGNGVRGIASGSGVGVYGENTQTAAVGRGVVGVTVSPIGGSAGVRGEHNVGTGSGVGVSGVTTSTTAGVAGVAGEHTGTSGAGFGVYGQTFSNSSLAAGVIGRNTAGGGDGVRGEVVDGNGVHGQSSGTGRAVWGEHTGTGTGSGVYGTSSSTNLFAFPVFGELTSATANGAGVRGSSVSPTGNGILAANTASVTTGAALRVEGLSRLSGPVVNGFSSSAISNYTILAGDNVVRLATGTLSAQVPSISSNYVGRVVYLINNVGTNITISAPGSVSFNGALGGSQLFGNGQVALCICVGTDAWVVRIF